MIRKIKSAIPNTITCCNLISGCVAVFFAFHLDTNFGGLDGRQWVYISIFAAAIFDFCDGLSARLLHAYSDMGKELDSLSDLVSFGVAPGALIFNTMLLHGQSVWLAAFALLIPVLGGLRLAKFNVDDSQSHTFKGLPIPANALFWIGLSDWIAQNFFPNILVMLALIILVAGCMVANFKMFSLKFKSLAFIPNIKRYAVIAAAVAFFIVYGVSGFAWTIALYILVSLFSKKNDDDDEA